MVTKSPALAEAAPIQVAGERSLHRLLGLIGMIGSPFLFVSFAMDGFENGDASRAAALVGLLFSIGWFAIVLGLRQLNAAGTRRWVKVLFAVQLFTVAMANLFQVYEAAAPGSDSILYTITDICWPLSMLLLLVTGIAMLRARVFEGWLRFTPLFAFLWLPMGITTLLVGDTAGMAFSAAWNAVGWFLMGYAVFRGGR